MFSGSEINKLREIGKQKKMYTHGKQNDTQLSTKITWMNDRKQSMVV